MKKIGLISDIHANLAALEHALDLLDGQNVDQIVCAGDVVEKGPDGDAVVDLLRSRAIPCVMGNHDYFAIGNQAWLRATKPFVPSALRARLLKAETLAFLRALPRTLVFTWEERQVFVAHGAPWAISDYVYPNSPPQLYGRIRQETQTDVVVLGHTHVPMCIEIEGTRVMNPGAVCGENDEGLASCAVLTLPECLLHIYNLKNGAMLCEYA